MAEYVDVVGGSDRTYVIAADNLSVRRDDGTLVPVVVGGILQAVSGGATATWATLTGKPTTFPPTIGTTADTALAGNYIPDYSTISGKDSGVRTTMKNKPQIVALTSMATGGDTAACITAINAIIAALKA